MGIRHLMIMTVCSAIFAASAASAATPMVKLRIFFDLEGSQLRGETEITLPAGTSATLHFGGLDVKSLLVDKAPAAPDPVANSVLLQASADDIVVQMHYEKHLQADGSEGGIISRQGIALFGAWHPWLSIDCRYALSAEIPVEFEAVSEAEEIHTIPKGEQKEVSFTFPHAVAGINFVAGPYVVEEVGFGTGQTLYSYFFAEDSELAAHYREKALGYLQRYTEILGPFPFKRFSIVENRLPTGYAMPTFTLLGQSVVRLPFIVDTSLGHEIVHAWFGNCVRVARNSGNWSEGLATYLADQTYAADRGEDIEYRKEQLTRYASFVHSHNTRTLGEFFGAAPDEGGEAQAIRAVGYDKASMVFHMLRRQLGDDVFHEGLRSFFRRMIYKRASWDDLRVVFEEVSNSSLKAFFEQWIGRSDVPALSISKVAISYPDGQPELSFLLRQHSENPFRLIVPLRLYTGEETVEKILQTDSLQKTVSLPLRRVPSALSLDPDYHLMRQLDENELPPVWSRFAGAVQKTVIVDDRSGEAFWQPFLDELIAMGCTVKKSSEAGDEDVAAGSVLFLGVESPLVQSLFAKVAHPVTGLTVDVRANPLKIGQVAVLVSSATAEQVAKAAYKLKHYGKYGYLHFEDGRMKEKEKQATMQGLRYLVDAPPPGMAMKSSNEFERLADELAASRVIHVGELHTSYEDHLLQFRIIRALYERDSQLSIGMEMFASNAQPVLDEFIAGSIDEKTFLKQARYFEQWGYDYRLYRDIILYARRHRIPIVGLNVEKDLVSRVFKQGGLSALEEEERSSLPPERNLAMPGYRERIYSVFTMHGEHGSSGGEFKDFIQSQALWDETMAETAAEWLTDNPDSRMVILAGRGHVLKDTAIPPRLARRLPQINQAVVVNGMRGEMDESLTDYVFFAQPEQLEPQPLMGIRMQEKDGVVKIIGVAEDSPAEKAGIRGEDELLSLDGQPVLDTEDIKIIMVDKKKGDSIVARLRRAGFFGTVEEIDVAMTL